MQYIRWWVDSLHNIKLWRLDLAQRGAWLGICTIAGECDKDGRLEKGGNALTIEDIVDILHVKKETDRKAVETTIDLMIKAGSLEWNDGHVLVVTNFKRRNETAPSATKEAVADRVRLHRDRQKQFQEDRQVDNKLAEFARAYEDDIGLITPMVGEQLKELSEEFSFEWFKEAIKQAVGSNVRRLNYVIAILNRWKTEGFKSKTSRAKKTPKLPTDEEIEESWKK